MDTTGQEQAFGQFLHLGFEKADVLRTNNEDPFQNEGPHSEKYAIQNQNCKFTSISSCKSFPWLSASGIVHQKLP